MDWGLTGAGLLPATEKVSVETGRLRDMEEGAQYCTSAEGRRTFSRRSFSSQHAEGADMKRDRISLLQTGLQELQE